MEISENFFRIIKDQTEEFLKKNLSSSNIKETKNLTNSNNRTSEEIKEDSSMMGKQEELLGKIV